MKEIHSSNNDDFSQIETLLGSFNPVPSERFYSILQAAPWIQKAGKPVKKKVFQGIPLHRFAFALVIVLMVVTTVGFLFFPSVRAIARQLFNTLVSATSNQLEVILPSTNPDELFNDADPVNFGLSILEAEEESNFDVREILHLPDDLELVGARYDSRYSAVISLYQSPDYKLFLTQHPLGDGRDVFSIGRDAQVQIVDILGEQAEWVTGGWKAISVTDSPSAEMETTVTAVWDNDLPQSTLRWQSGGTMYELRAIGVERPSQSEMISLANELK